MYAETRYGKMEMYANVFDDIPEPLPPSSTFLMYSRGGASPTPSTWVMISVSGVYKWLALSIPVASSRANSRRNL